MKYTVKQIDGEWCVVEKDTDDIVADATDRKDAVLQASALNREESNSESKPKFHRGSSYGNKPEAELSEGPVSNNIDKALDYMYELTDDGEMAKNAYHRAKFKFKLGDTESEILLNDWNDSHRSDRKNFIKVETINESSEEYGGSIIPAYHVATDFKRQMNRMKTNKVPEDKIMNFLSSYDEVMQEANGKEQLTPELAKGILNDLEIEGKDFFTLSSSKVHELLDVAKQYGYKKSKNAPGSTARIFHQYIQHLAKKAKGEEINELSKDTLGSYVKKAAFDNGMAGFRQGKAVGNAGKYHKRPDNATANAEANRGERRMKGIDRAVKKLTEEEINESLSLEDTIKSIIKS